MNPRHEEGWKDMSDYLIHFTKAGPSEGEDYETMMLIYWEQRLLALKIAGIARHDYSDFIQKTVSFTEIPFGQLERIVERRGTKYGIAFSKKNLISKECNPLWYVWRETQYFNIIHNMMASEKSNPNADIWKIAPFIEDPSDGYDFVWEREWRHIGDFLFEPEEVAFLLIPQEFHDAARGFFENALQDNTGPAYLCPYIDPLWSEEKINSVLKKG